MKIRSKVFYLGNNSGNLRRRGLLVLINLIFLLLSGCNTSTDNAAPNPIADAGINQSVNEQSTVTLQGFGTAVVGSIDSVNWQQTAGDSVTIATPDSLTTQFEAPITQDSPQTLTFQLTVRDDAGQTGSDTVVITVFPVNFLPIVSVGSNQVVLGSETVDLVGSGVDADGTIVSYLWTQTSGSSVSLVDATVAVTSFVAPVIENQEDLVFELTVTDNEDGVGVASVTITVGSEFGLADGINGGRLYSKFWADETGFNLGNSNLQSQTELDAITSRSDFFRCKQCHGWDRLGRLGGYSNRAPKTSRPNIADLDLAAFAASATVEELFNAVKIGTATRRDISTDLSSYDPAVDPTIGDQMPDYSQIFTDGQIWELAKYLKADALDTTQLYDITLEDGTDYPNRGRTFSNLGKDGDALSGEGLYATNCATCHGDDGTQILVDGGEFTLGAHLRSKPYEDQHKVKFGNLGSTMFAVMATSPLSDIKDLLKAFTDSTKFPDSQPADGINGGRLYSKFWATETGFTLANSNLQSQAELDAITSRSDFFRCKQCHGWDRLGREGGYSNRSPNISRPNIADLDLVSFSEVSTEQEIFDAIKTGSTTRRDISVDLSTYDPAVDPTIGDQMPNYSQILTDKQILELAKYLKTDALDTTKLYDITLEDGTVYPNRARTFTNIGLDGDAVNGDVIYDDNCASCHGADGTAILVDGGAFTLGAHLRAKPYEDQHKVKFGNLGSTMGAIMADSAFTDVVDLFKAMTDTVAFPDTAPVIVDGAALFEARCGSCHTGNGLGTGAVSDVTGATAAQITAAINGGSPAMATLSDLTVEEIQAIADAL